MSSENLRLGGLAVLVFFFLVLICHAMGCHFDGFITIKLPSEQVAPVSPASQPSESDAPTPALTPAQKIMRDFWRLP